VRLSEFQRAVRDEFGSRAAAVVTDLTLAGVAHRTAAQALEEGVPPRTVWLALCAEMDVPESRRHGVGHLEPRAR
jgi:hypothetical protein